MFIFILGGHKWIELYEAIACGEEGTEKFLFCCDWKTTEWDFKVTETKENYGCTN